MTHAVKAFDGRKLSVEIAGDPDGTPSSLMHGTPGGRCGPRPRGIVLHRLGVRLISYDRPGYPGSERKQDRTGSRMLPTTSRPSPMNLDFIDSASWEGREARRTRWRARPS